MIIESFLMRQIQWLKSKFYVAFLCIYDVIRLHQVSGSSNYDDAMTKQVPGVSWANFVGQHVPSIPIIMLTLMPIYLQGLFFFIFFVICSDIFWNCLFWWILRTVFLKENQSWKWAIISTLIGKFLGKKDPQCLLEKGKKQKD